LSGVRAALNLPAFVLLAATLALPACAPHSQPAARPASSGTPPPTSAPTSAPTGAPPARRPAPPAAPVSPHYTEEGVASWYGVPYHGRRAANGEIYDMYKLTAAHRTLPFETIVRVTNKKNGKQVEVRITDRGPFVEGRIIDLSLGAARELDMVGMGIAPVHLEIVSATASPTLGLFTVQVGAFLSRENAERLRKQMEERYSFATIQEYDAPQGLFYRVRVGKLSSEDAAKTFGEKLRVAEHIQPFVVRLDPTPGK
jgi:rare lipoprotein A